MLYTSKVNKEGTVKQFRILMATVLLGSVGYGAYFMSNWTQEVPNVIVPEVSAAPLAGHTQPSELGDCPFLVDGICYTCDSPEAFAIETQEECSKCSNRKAIYTGGAEIESWACALQTCPKSHPIKAESDNCFSCDETRAIDYFPENGDSGANLCPNRVLNDSALVLKKCPSSHPLVDPLGGCYTCTEQEDVYTTSENCADCPNRSFEAGGQFGRCYLN
jgi:hypothetical protein